MIEIKTFSKKFGKLQVLDQVSLTCLRGECIALIGPNGCGKTTLIKALLGMVIGDKGSVFFQGKNIKGEWLYREKIGYMPQIGRYPENMKIGQLFTMMKDIRNHTDKQLDEALLYDLELNRMLDKRMGTLSGGTRQKVSAALAFLFNPDVLILDEPTAGLDPISSDILKNKIIEETKKGKLILITSHILSELEEIVSEIVFMQEGRICFHKPLYQLQQDSGQLKLSKAIAYAMQVQMAY